MSFEQELVFKVLEKLELVMRRAMTNRPISQDASACITCGAIAHHINEYLKENEHRR